MIPAAEACKIALQCKYEELSKGLELEDGFIRKAIMRGKTAHRMRFVSNLDYVVDPYDLVVFTALQTLRPRWWARAVPIPRAEWHPEIRTWLEKYEEAGYTIKINRACVLICWCPPCHG